MVLKFCGTSTGPYGTKISLLSKEQKKGQSINTSGFNERIKIGLGKWKKFFFFLKEYV